MPQAPSKEASGRSSHGFMHRMHSLEGLEAGQWHKDRRFVVELSLALRPALPRIKA